MKTLAAGLALGMLAGGINIKALEPTDVAMDDAFHLVDFETSEILEGSYDTFRSAKSVYNDIKADYVNLGIVKNGQTYEAEYALALFHVSDACDFEVTYTNTSDGTEGTVNGCYGVDAAYLYTDDEGEYVTFSLSGVTGQASVNDVTVIPLQNVFVNLSMFTVRGGNLYHMIKGEMDDDYYGYIVDLGTAPDYLAEGKAYYSYDGHYFYSDDMLYGMLDDYRNGIRDNSVNPENPWYNWYQFVSHRTITHINPSDLREYLTGQMELRGPIDRFLDTDKDGSADILNQSQFYGIEDILFQSQYEFGANALMMLAISDMESDTGRGSFSYTRNNLFSHAAYDTESEAELGRYYDLRTSVYSHAKYYLSGSYLSPMKEQYNGGFFGNKSAGMNVRYSSDPYWGEKAAAAYRAYDELFGTQDAESVQLGIRTVENETIVYHEPNTDNPIYATGAMPDMAFVILDEVTDDAGNTWYQIQSDATLGEDGSVDLSYYYDWTDDVAYIKADSVQILLGNRSEPADYVHVKFNADGGSFVGGETEVSYDIPSGKDAVAASPVKESALFEGFDSDTASVMGDREFNAAYKTAISADFTSLPKTEYELNDRIDLRGGIVTVHFEDGSEQEIPLTSSMVSGFDMSSDGEQTVSVRAAGMDTSYTIQVSAELDDARAAMKERILSLISDYGEDQELGETDVERILSVKQDMDQSVQPYLSMPELRSYDTILRKVYSERIRYVIVDNNYGFGVSGLSSSIPLEEGQLEKNSADADTYRISIDRGIRSDAKEKLSKEAEVLGETILDTFTISLSKNLDEIEPSGAILCSVARPNASDAGDVYTVLSYTEDGDIIRCYTRQTTNTISFMTDSTGEFLLMSRNTSNAYVGADPVEALTQENSSTDIRAIIAQVGIAGLVLVVIVFASMYLIGKLRRKKNRVKHEVKKAVIAKDSENLEVTQALEILNTEMLRLDEIRKAEEEMKKKDDQHNDSAA